MVRCFIVALALLGFAACNNKPAPGPETAQANPQPVSQPAAAPATASSAEVQRALGNIAGNGATDCGQVASMGGEEVKKASDCAMDAAKAKKPFTVSYAMPGLTIGIAGNAAGKLFTVQSQVENGKEVEPKSEPCPAALRLAQSGRVTCFEPGSMGMTPGTSNPHGGTNPHGGAANPHQQPGPRTSH